MFIKIRNRKGYTLIELLIVIVLICILLAIAIPQFAAYRSKAYDTAALLDLKNWKSGMEAYFAENKTYPAYYDAH